MFNDFYPSTGRVFGTSNNSGLEDKFGEKGSVGTQSEKVTDKTLYKIAFTNPDLYIFHSLKLPGQEWDIDHIVLYKNLLVMIDDKHWAHNANYTLMADDNPENDYQKINPYTLALKNRERFEGNVLKPFNSVLSIKEYLPEYIVMPLYVVHGYNISVEEEFEEYKFGFITIADLEGRLRFLMSRIEDSGNPHDLLLQDRTIRFLTTCLPATNVESMVAEKNTKTENSTPSSLISKIFQRKEKLSPIERTSEKPNNAYQNPKQKTDEELFIALKRWRTEKARKKRWSPAFIAHDSSLRAIIYSRPKNLSSLKKIKNLNKTIISEYGQEIIDILS